MGIASRMNLLGTETAFEVLSRARNLEAQGKQIVHLEIGEPDFDTPSHIVDAGVQALKDGYTHYGPTPGLPQLREAISENSRKVRGLNTDPNSVPSSAVTAAPTQSLSGQNELTGFGKENMSGPVWGAPVDAQPSGNLATQGISEWGDKGYASEQAMSNSYSSASPSGWSGMADAGAPTVETQSIGFGGRQEFVGDNTSNIAQDSTTLGGTDKKDGSSWGSAAGWDAAGNIMQGVGGLASAWTGIQNYKLARDAYNTQKNQWQADYNQRLKAYEDNKQLANQEIEARNRTLQARGQEANQYSKLA